MFIEMKKQRFAFSFGKAQLWLRYDIRAFFNIEDSGYKPFDIISQCGDPAAVRCFLENGLSDWYNSVRRDKNSLDEYVNRLMSAQDYQTELIAVIQSAILQALPEPVRGSRRKEAGDANILSLMTAFVDVMGASEEEFMSSTVREASARWERYAVAMGYMKPAERFSRFDDDED